MQSDLFQLDQTTPYYNNTLVIGHWNFFVYGLRFLFQTFICLTWTSRKGGLVPPHWVISFWLQLRFYVEVDGTKKKKKSWPQNAEEKEKDNWAELQTENLGAQKEETVNKQRNVFLKCEQLIIYIIT